MAVTRRCQSTKDERGDAKVEYVIARNPIPGSILSVISGKSLSEDVISRGEKRILRRQPD